MKTLPYVSVYIPWAAMILCEIALFVLLWKRPAQTRYRGFEAYVTFSVAVSLVLLVCSFPKDGSYYFTAYYLGAFLKTIAIGLATYEQFKLMFFPRWSMSDRTFKFFMSALVAVVLGSIAVVAFTPQRTPVWELALARRIVSLNDYLLCGSMGLLLLYGEFLKTERPQRAQAIVRGMIGAGILGTTASLMLAVSGTRELGGLVGFSTTIGFVAVLISWIVAFSKPEEVVATDGTEDSPLDALGEARVHAHAVVSHMLMWKL
jgi:hypothetical protein